MPHSGNVALAVSAFHRLNHRYLRSVCDGSMSKAVATAGCPRSADSVEKLRSRSRSKILKPLQATAIARHEGTLGSWARLPAGSYISLDACQTRIDARTLTLQQNHTAADLEFFNRIGGGLNGSMQQFERVYLQAS